MQSAYGDMLRICFLGVFGIMQHFSLSVLSSCGYHPLLKLPTTTVQTTVVTQII